MFKPLRTKGCAPPPFLLRLFALPPKKNFQKGGLAGSQFLKGVAGKEGWR